MKPVLTSAWRLVVSLLFLLSVPGGSALAELQFSPSIPDPVRTKILQDLNFTQSIQGRGATPVYNQIFGASLNGRELIAFFANRITGFDTNDCGSGSGVVACVRPDRDTHVMWLTQNYATYDMPQILRIALTFHEARHTEDENSHWAHARCPTPFKDANGEDVRSLISGTLFAGQFACDTTPYGAYGLQAELLKNVQFFCTNCSEKMRMDARIFGDDALKRIYEPRAHQVLANDLNAR